jgi:hypothetical protein
VAFQTRYYLNHLVQTKVGVLRILSLPYNKTPPYVLMCIEAIRTIISLSTVITNAHNPWIRGINKVQNKTAGRGVSRETAVKKGHRIKGTDRTKIPTRYMQAIQ